MLDISPDQTRPAPVAGLVEFARAKINLALHVVDRRADGYHLLDSVVTFCETGDRLTIASSEQDTFTISGRFAAGLGDAADNLVLKARDGLRARLAAAGVKMPPVSIHLEKNLPVASGIGGGSADAAAALHGLMRIWNVDLEPQEGKALALSLGADVPMCLAGQPLSARGIGEDIMTLPDMPSMALVLVNPLIGVSTPAIFQALLSRDNPPVGALPTSGALSDWIDCLANLRNDLEPAATLLVPEIAAARGLLDRQGALLSRMSGSGATCFGIFEAIETAQAAAEAIAVERSDWYVAAAKTVGEER
jgi:4-diphosphocytidyl-2-C-methyl-D-erythritol kinase